MGRSNHVPGSDRGPAYLCLGVLVVLATLWVSVPSAPPDRTGAASLPEAEFATSGNVSYQPCSLTNYTLMYLGNTAGQSDTPAELANLTHYLRIISSAWNSTCELPAFVSMVSAHIRSMSNFYSDEVNSGILTANATVDGSWGAVWWPNGSETHYELWSWNGVTGAVTGPSFLLSPEASMAPPVSPGSGSSVTGALISNLLPIAGVVSAAIAVAVLTAWSRGRIGGGTLERWPGGSEPAATRNGPGHSRIAEGDSLDFLT